MPPPGQRTVTSPVPPPSGRLATVYAPAGLASDPFPIAAADGAWVDIPSHRPGRTGLRDWVTSGPEARPLCVVTGDPGSGRTRLHGWLARELDAIGGLAIATLADPGGRWTDRELVRDMLTGLDAEPTGRNGLELIAETRRRIAALRQAGTVPLLLIDGATFAGSQLEVLLTLLSGDRDTPRVVLFGSHDLGDRIRRRRSLASRATVVEALPPLAASEVEQFVTERIAAMRPDAPGEPPDPTIFAEGALLLIAEWTEGNLGLVNRVAGESLFAALTEGAARVERTTVSRVVRELTDEVRQVAWLGSGALPGEAVQTRLALPLFEDEPVPPRRRGRRRQ